MMTDNKNIIRQEIKFKRERLSSVFTAAASEKITESVISLDCVKNAETFLLYADFKNEVGTGKLIAMLLMAGKKVFLPRVSGDCILIGEFSLKNCITNKFGITEPDVSEQNSFPAEDIDIFIVPGIAFDRRGGRIGFGRGYYDRLLNECSSGIKIALAYDMQMVDNTFSGEFDVAMDMIITEKEIIRRA